MTEWVRLYHDMPTDPKWRVIAKRAGQRIGDVLAVFLFVLCNASGNAVKRGVTHGLVTEDIAAAVEISDENVRAILAAMEGKVIRDGVLTGWKKRNPIREDSSTERVRRFRETQKPKRNAEKRPESESESTKRHLSDSSDPSKRKQAEVGTKRAVRTAYPEGFEKFWKGYPTDRLMSKKQAAQAFSRLDAADKVAAIESTSAFRTYCAKHTTYRPLHAVRFLNQRRFDSFAPVAPVDSAKLADAKDRADRLMHRGKYAEGNGEPPAQTPRSLGGLLDG